MSDTGAAAVLIVEGNAAVRRTIADSLRNRGFAVAAEPDGEWAFETFRRRPFDAVVTELNLKAMGGAELIHRIRGTEGGRDVTVILTTAASELDEATAVGRELGAAAVLSQPLRAQALLTELHRALGDRYPTPPPTAEPSKSEELSFSEELADREAKAEVTDVEKLERAATLPPYQTPMAGELASRPFPRVLAEAARWKATGGLLLRREKIKKIVYLRQGVPQLVKSNLLSECLGRVMVREGMISEEQCAESLQRMKASSRQQGTVLLEMGCINPHNLVYALNLQLRTKLTELFAWESGQFQFNPNLPLPAEPVLLDQPPVALLYEGIRRTYDAARLSRELGALGLTDASYLCALEELPDSPTGLDDEEEAVLHFMDGRSTVGELRSRGPLQPLDFDRLLYALLCAQRVEVSAKRTGRGPRKPTQTAVSGPPPPLPSRASGSKPEAAPPPLPSRPAARAAPPVLRPPAAEDSMGKVFAAEGKFQRGEELLRSRQYEQAYQHFQEAVMLYGQEGDFHAYLGWSRFQSAPRDPSALEEALSALETAVQLNPRSDKPYLFSGYIYKATGRPDRAERNFERAIQCNPDCVEALRELRLLSGPRA